MFLAKPLSFVKICLTFSITIALGFKTLTNLINSKNNLFLGSFSICCLLPAENPWHGGPPIIISTLFFPKSSDGNWEYLRNNIEVIRGDYNCIYSYSGVDLYQLGASGTKGMELLYKFDAGEFGTVGFYGFPDDIYVYTREGNKLIMDVGDGKNTNTFLITEGGLILSGGGSYTKYNPNTTY